MFNKFVTGSFVTDLIANSSILVLIVGLHKTVIRLKVRDLRSSHRGCLRNVPNEISESGNKHESKLH